MIMSLNIENIKPGDILYDVKQSNMRERIGGNKYVYWEVKVLDVDIPNGRILISWNNNKERWHYGNINFRKNRPE